jgi:hypothetical protein
MDVVPVKLTRLETSDSPSHMATFAAQIKDKFLGLVDHVVAGCGLAGGGKDVQEPTKLHTVAPCRYLYFA